MTRALRVMNSRFVLDNSLGSTKPGVKAAPESSLFAMYLARGRIRTGTIMISMRCEAACVTAGVSDWFGMGLLICDSLRPLNSLESSTVLAQFQSIEGMFALSYQMP